MMDWSPRVLPSFSISQCYACGELGHVARDCPDLVKKAAIDKRLAKKKKKDRRWRCSNMKTMMLARVTLMSAIKFPM